MSDNKRIAKNTLFLYFRMLLIMGVTLFTSRVVLDKLGVDDYGLYNVVGGVVGMLSFINGTLSIGTMRFLTAELGRKDVERLPQTFNTAFYTHLGLSLILAIFLETVGLWFVYNKLVIPPVRLDAAVFAYHISIATSIVSITQVPYTSLIMAHERMGVYAYISIFEAIAKLVVAYFLSISYFDRLVVYAILIALVQVMVAMFYRFYCRQHFSESKLYLYFDKSTFKSLMDFSGWNLIANLSESLKSQGYIVLINMFFKPFVVTSQTIANQISGTVLQFVMNFRTAVNPQIIKLYAAGNYEESKKLAISSTIFVFDLLLLLCLPTIFIMDTIMHIWLVDVPQYAVIFSQLALIQRLISAFDASFYVPMMASGKVRTNSIYAVVFGPGTFIVLYLLFKHGFDVMWIQYVGIIVMFIYSFYIKPSILIKEVEGYNYKDFIPCYFTCFKVATISLGVSFLFYKILGNQEILPSIILFLISFISVASTSFCFLDRTIRLKIINMMIQRFKYSKISK